MSAEELYESQTVGLLLNRFLHQEFHNYNSVLLNII